MQIYVVKDLEIILDIRWALNVVTGISIRDGREDTDAEAT